MDFFMQRTPCIRRQLLQQIPIWNFQYLKKIQKWRDSAEVICGKYDNYIVFNNNLILPV